MGAFLVRGKPESGRVNGGVLRAAEWGGAVA